MTAYKSKQKCIGILLCLVHSSGPHPVSKNVVTLVYIIGNCAIIGLWEIQEVESSPMLATGIFTPKHYDSKKLVKSHDHFN